jgi:methylenetetrahydrofolate reductase (NADPH)
MGAPGGYNPSRLLAKTGVALADPTANVEGLHVFTFNQVRQSEEWRRTVLADQV